MTRLPPRLAADRRGTTLVEFALIAPVLCMLLVGGFDVAHTLYMKAVIQGVVQKAARDATLEAPSGMTSDAVDAALDAKVTAQILALNKTANVPPPVRRFYRTFSAAAAAQAEAWTDTDKDGTCDHGEPYVDSNNNSVWDKDGGDGGQGGAKDRTLYTVNVSYPHMFPFWKFMGGSNMVKIQVTTILENQPYTDQGSYTSTPTRNCT